MFFSAWSTCPLAIWDSALATASSTLLSEARATVGAASARTASASTASASTASVSSMLLIAASDLSQSVARRPRLDYKRPCYAGYGSHRALFPYSMQLHIDCQSCRRPVAAGPLTYTRGERVLHNEDLLQCDVCE